MLRGIPCHGGARTIDRELHRMPMRRSISQVWVAVLAIFLVQLQSAVALEIPPVVSLDLKKGTLEGSPVDHLPPNIRLLDIQLPDGGRPMRADWSPDGQRLVFLDAPIGDVWEYELGTGATRNLTETFLPAGVLRAHHLSNGDLLVCALTERSTEDPEGDRFRGTLWVLQQPLGHARSGSSGRELLGGHRRIQAPRLHPHRVEPVEHRLHRGARRIRRSPRRRVEHPHGTDRLRQRRHADDRRPDRRARQARRLARHARGRGAGLPRSSTTATPTPTTS